ncbi:MAG: type II toxin-antitoxin system HicB family antitoxin [Dehalococcoidia bacterium]
MTREFTVVVHQEEDSYWASVVELPGCFSQGRTEEELRDNIREAIELYLYPGPSDADLSDEELEIEAGWDRRFAASLELLERLGEEADEDLRTGRPLPLDPDTR